MKVFITKYCLTKGIQEMDVEQWGPDTVGKIGALYPCYFHGEGKEWHRTMELAISKAEEIRNKKIASLKKNIVKLESMKFN